MKLTQLALTGLFVAATSMVTMTAVAGPEHKHERKDHHEMMMKKLELTEEQRSQVEALHDSKSGQMQALQSQMKDVKKQLHQAMKSDSFDAGLVRTLLHRQADLKADMMVQKNSHRQQMKTILTAEQQAKMHEIKSKMKERHHEYNKKRHAEHSGE
ncbi:MAG: Spy/CpxP family protein refolding chaperone [Kangiellaceae bacterium]|nr:Spy/CpxP family protein refolding chaperone [Kangiellaceae bacterium]